MIVARRLALGCVACGPIPSVLAVIPGRTIATTRLVELVTTRLTAKFSLGLATEFPTGLATKFTTRLATRLAVKLASRLAKFRPATGTVSLSLRARGVM